MDSAVVLHASVSLGSQCGVSGASGLQPLSTMQNSSVGTGMSVVEVPDSFLAYASPRGCPTGWVLGGQRRWTWNHESTGGRWSCYRVRKPSGGTTGLTEAESVCKAHNSRATVA